MYDVIIAGGGIAGCAAAVRLARTGRHVLLIEKKTYPAPKLCGEFLSTEVTAAFDRLGILTRVRRAEPHVIRTARVTATSGASFTASLPGAALGLSRYTLDALLFDAAREAGADTRDGSMVRNIEGSLRDGFTVTTASDTFEASVVLGAFGKRSWLDGALSRPFVRGQYPTVAFKAHFEGVNLGDAIELHAFPGGYCGLSHVEDGRVNVCWIGASEALKAAGGTPEGMMEHNLSENRALGERLRAMEQVSDRFEAVSQVCLDEKGAFAGDVCMIGDTAAMIAPACGDGMAMALRAAELAAPLVDRFLEGAVTASDYRETYEAAWQDDFGLRLRLGRIVHRTYTRPRWADIGVRACRLVPPLGRWLIRETRG